MYVCVNVHFCMHTCTLAYMHKHTYMYKHIYTHTAFQRHSVLDLLHVCACVCVCIQSPHRASCAISHSFSLSLFLSPSLSRARPLSLARSLSFASSLFVANLAPELTDEALKLHMARFGALAACRVVMDKGGASKGFGYVDFADAASVRFPVV